MITRQSIYLLYLFLLAELVNGQIVPSTNFSFEKLQWGQTVEKVSEILHRSLTETPKIADRVTFPFSNKGIGTINYFYEDTVWEQRLIIMLSFSKEKGELDAIMVAYYGIDVTTKKALPDAEKRAEFLWQKFTDRFGKPKKVTSMPFVGKGSDWSLPNTEVKMFSISFNGVNMLAVQYSPKKK